MPVCGASASSGSMSERETEVCGVLDRVEIIKIIKGHPEYSRWAIVLSGDVGFYSGAKALTKACKEAGISVDIVPGIASVVYLAAKLGISWEDAAALAVSMAGIRIRYYAIDQSCEDIFSCWTGKAERSFVNRSGNTASGRSDLSYRRPSVI